MAQTLETAYVFPIFLVLILALSLQGTQALRLGIQKSVLQVEEAKAWVQNSRMYERRGKYLITQPEKMMELLDLIDDLQKRVGDHAEH